MAPGARGTRRTAKPGKHPLRNFTLWVALPTVAVFSGVCCLVFLTMHMMSAEMNAIDANRGRNAIAAAIDSLVLGLGERAVDEATWTEAYLNTYVEPNPAWHDSAWGATARISDNYDTALVTDTRGKIVFGETSRGPLTGTLADHFSGAAQLLAELEAGISATGGDATVKHLSRNSHGVAALAGDGDPRQRRPGQHTARGAPHPVAGAPDRQPGAARRRDPLPAAAGPRQRPAPAGRQLDAADRRCRRHRRDHHLAAAPPGRPRPSTARPASPR